MPSFNRRRFLQAASVAAAALSFGERSLFANAPAASPLARQPLLRPFPYSAVSFSSGLAQSQLEATHAVLMELPLNNLLRPFRVREGQPAPGDDLGGWYDVFAFAPAHAYGQWLSALARYTAITGDPATRDKVNAMVDGYRGTISPNGRFYLANRFPAYTYDKLTLGLLDAHTFAGSPAALDTLRLATAAARPYLPPAAVPRSEAESTAKPDVSYGWDESYTLPENQFLAWQRTGDPQYRAAGERFLMNDTFFDPLARGENVLPGKHAYSHVNALSSAAQAYLVLGDDKYLRAARNGFRYVLEQSFATGGWGPAEHFRPPGSGELGSELETEHASFETPCGSYAHFKIARYLVGITGESHYGDSMERVLYNTVLGARTLQADGHAFYYSDYTPSTKKAYHPDRWPCCSGSLPQIAADYRISTYMRDASGPAVLLYLPSTLRWQQGTARCELTQESDYPFSPDIRFEISASRDAEFALRLRIPQWAEGARLEVNGRPQPRITPGQFATVTRTWKSGDTVELHLPLKPRLEPVDAQHPRTVALLRGPLVYFAVREADAPAIHDGGPGPRLTAQQLLAATRAPGSDRALTAQTASGTPVRLLPFPFIRDESYTTYQKI